MDRPAVLAVEDEAVILAAVEDALIEGGYAVVACSSAADALRELEEGQAFAGLVTDIRLIDEQVSGWDIARRSRELLPAIGVVYMSGDSGIDWRAQGVPDSTFVQNRRYASRPQGGVKTPFTEHSICTAGESAGLIYEVERVDDIVNRTVKGFQELCLRLGKIGRAAKISPL